jgi:hypothetical protein
MYSSTLTASSHIYASNGCGLFNYYYEAIQVEVVETSKYHFSISSTIRTYGSIYNSNFDPIDPTRNVLPQDYWSCIDGQLKQEIVLSVNTTYILVVTTASPNVIGNFSILVSGPNNVSFNRISKYLYYLMNNQHRIHKILVNPILSLNL